MLVQAETMKSPGYARTQLGEVSNLVDGLTLSASRIGTIRSLFPSPPSFVLETLDANVVVFVNGLSVTSRTLEVRDEPQIATPSSSSGQTK